jgi:hypothetical protein
MGANSIVPEGREKTWGCSPASNNSREWTERLSWVRAFILLGLLGRCALLAKTVWKWRGPGIPALPKTKIFTSPPERPWFSMFRQAHCNSLLGEVGQVQPRVCSRVLLTARHQFRL